MEKDEQMKGVAQAQGTAPKQDAVPKQDKAGGLKQLAG